MEGDFGKRSSFHMNNGGLAMESKPIRWQCLYFLIGILMATTVVFAVLFGVYYMKYDDASQDGTTDKVIQSQQKKNQTTSNNSKVCNTTNCVATAGFLLTKMDLTADPCQDWHQFVCGKINQGPYRTDVEDTMRIERDNFLITLLDEFVQPDDLQFVKKMKQLFRQCLDTDTIEERGLHSYKKSRFPNNWPTLNSNWDPSSFDLNDYLIEYNYMFDFGLFQYGITEHPDDPTKYILGITTPDLCISSGKSSLFRTYRCQQYYAAVAKAAGADNDNATSDARSDQLFQKELKSITPTVETGGTVTLGELASGVPVIDWQRVLQASFDKSGVILHPHMQVYIQYPDYFESLGDLLEQTDPRDIANRLAFLHANSMTKDLTEELTKAYRTLEQSEDSDDNRYDKCLNIFKEEFNTGLSKMFIDRTFALKANKYVREMVELIKETFGEELEKLTWMGDVTKQEALQKLEAMTFRIGFPTENFSGDDVDREYENLTVTSDDFYASRYSLGEVNTVEEQRALTRSVESVESDWRYEAYGAEGFYTQSTNQIDIYAGILQPGEFSLAYPSSISFGAPGWLIGHEISHGFDDYGRQFDGNGDIRDWWTPEDVKNFTERAKCFVDQYSKFSVPEVPNHVNGTLTLGENIADNGGLNIAFKAYKKYAASHRQELPLPGLGLTTDQQFFVGLAQKFCNKKAREEYQHQFENDEHAPEKFRIIGSAMNSEDFAKAFNCPAGSPMNPVNKCVLW